MKNLRRRLWGYFVPFTTSKWQTCAQVNLNLIFVMPQHTQQVPAASAIQPSAGSAPAQLSCAQQEKRPCCVVSTEAALGHPHLLYSSSSAPAPSQTADLHGSAGWMCWWSVAGAAPSACAELSVQAQQLPDCRRPICWGYGVSSSSAGGHATARSFQRSGKVVWIPLKSLSQRQKRMCTNKNSKNLSVFSPSPAFKSLLSHPSQTPLSSGSSLCLQLFQLISEPFNVSSYYDASIYYSNMGTKHAWEKRKSKDYKYIFLAFCS